MTSHVLHLGDCLDPVTGLASLPDKSVDHVICDPPYSEEVHAGRNRTKHINGYAVNAIDFEPISEAQIAALAERFARVSRRWVAVFMADQSLAAWMRALGAAGLRYMRTMAWVKTDPMPQMSGDRPAHGFELIALAHAAGRSRWGGGGKTNVYTGHRIDTANRGHPTQKPEWLMDQLVRDFTDAGETILDPFAGSGTTGVACKRLGRNFIGWERDPKYHSIAEKRIAATREQLGLWTGAA